MKSRDMTDANPNEESPGAPGPLSRRRMLGALGATAVLGACAGPGPGPLTARAVVRPAVGLPGVESRYLQMYGEIADGKFHVPAVNLRQINPRFLRSEVSWMGPEAPGSIIVDTTARYLYLVQRGGRAIRYGVGVGREEGLNFKGAAIIERKAEWPRWIPTPDMIKRDPKRYEPYREGMDGGPGNPLGARALYLYQNGKDTYYRLHGTNEPYSIGTMVSSGCVRLLNQDIIDLYERVPTGTHVDVRSGGVLASLLSGG